MAYLYTFTPKASPISTDYLYLASTADSGAERKVTLASILTSQTLTNCTLTNPTMTTPTLGVASATSINKVAITAPATGATLTIADGTALIKDGAYNLTLYARAAVTLYTPLANATIAGLEIAQTWDLAQTFTTQIVASGGLAAADVITCTSSIKSSGSSLANNGIGYATGSGGTATEAAGAVTVTKLCGTITTSSLTTAAAGEYTITVTSTGLAATDVPVAAIKTYSGAGAPLAVVTRVAANTFTITITNLHATDALNATMTISYAIIKAVAA